MFLLMRGLESNELPSLNKEFTYFLTNLLSDYYFLGVFKTLKCSLFRSKCSNLAEIHNNPRFYVSHRNGGQITSKGVKVEASIFKTLRGS